MLFTADTTSVGREEKGLCPKLAFPMVEELNKMLPIGYYG
jgi:hypothetical protein